MAKKEKNEVRQDEAKDDVETLKSQIADLKDKLLRAAAESQNIQKRADKEKSDIAKYSVSEFAKDVLSIRDNLQRAIASCVETTGAIVEGVKLTLSELDKVLKRYNITMIESLDKEFDPHFHQAVAQIENNDKKPGTIVQVMQEGFMIHDRLLRPALVNVSKKQ
ncbi:MAG: nucleotide exchange factor GrpE [Holosporales bacterium]|jgi:molecular chaperone GrpE|nr:nucleotide exchange factor GrpE [Holosporales bacterium]